MEEETILSRFEAVELSALFSPKNERCSRSPRVSFAKAIFGLVISFTSLMHSGGMELCSTSQGYKNDRSRA
jgi:hypothetical protein